MDVNLFVSSADDSVFLLHTFLHIVQFLWKRWHAGGVVYYHHLWLLYSVNKDFAQIGPQHCGVTQREDCFDFG